MKKCVCVIPARLESKRFPEKILSMLGSKPLLQWVWEAAYQAKAFEQVIFAIDDVKTGDLIDTFGGKWVMTSKDCRSGTERLIEVFCNQNIEADVWVNWQADEPFISEGMIGDLLQSIDDEQTDIWTLKKQITSQEGIDSPHVVKVVTDQNGDALYFSRSKIPAGGEVFYKHVGIYAYATKSLSKMKELSPSALEIAESLEQLRYLLAGFKIRVHSTMYESLGIDLPEHLLAAEQSLR